MGSRRLDTLLTELQTEPRRAATIARLAGKDPQEAFLEAKRGLEQEIVTEQARLRQEGRQ